MESNEEFEVFRDFNKKNPKVYNENLEDISNTFNIDKTKGNQFFIEQTGIDENLFFTTMTMCQNEVVLDNSKQNTLIQKITNIVSSGDDNTSYKKTMDRLNKKLLDEVGTNRTTERPINIINDEIDSIERDKKGLEFYKTRLQDIDNEQQIIKNQLVETSNTVNLLKDIKEYKQKETLEKQKIGINTTKLNEYNNKLNELKKSKTQKDSINKKGLNPIFVLIICILIDSGSVLFKNNVISATIGVLSAIIFFINYCQYNKYKKKLNKQKEEEIKYNKEIEIIEESIKQCNKEIEADREEIEKKQMREKQVLLDKYGNKIDIDEYILEEAQEITFKIEELQAKLNENALKENTLAIEKNNISSKIEGLVKQVERLQYLYEQQAELKKLANSINIAQNGLEEAYTIMKSTITPKFTENLTSIIDNITSGKYKKVRFSDEDGLTVELNNGEYINCSRLSIGTIDQMYLALRISILNEISKETMPVLLDEAFAYYDENRLKNILKYISSKYSNRQIIILTCTNREIEALNNLNVKYNLINL